ncbi:hypothetical protein DPMN_027237 [Dreissena polymorpha]|uniref:Uncharacterized protein n=1 Tax=Dreissena polymorpha TaxID=45954 RepID=A0A9D4LWM3_DREPO|nr:hypothetical protein DPMN_027237 [Dreissena polymorpha]
MAHFLLKSELHKIESEKGKESVKRTVKSKTADVDNEMRDIREQRARLVEERKKSRKQLISVPLQKYRRKRGKCRRRYGEYRTV